MPYKFIDICFVEIGIFNFLPEREWKGNWKRKPYKSSSIISNGFLTGLYVRATVKRSTSINKYRPKFKVLEKPVIFLTKEELLKLYSFQIPTNGTKVKLIDMNGLEYEKTVQEAGALEKTRDLFCFCAFTSLRYSDMAKVKPSDIDGETLYITTQKTNDRLPIDMNKFAKDILKNTNHLGPKQVYHYL